MVKVLFVCYGNICRSPMAEFIFNYLTEKRGINNLMCAESAATSSEEVGNPVHFKTKKILDNMGIDCSAKHAKKIKFSDYKNFDYIIVMDDQNYRDVMRTWPCDSDKKIFKLLSFCGSNADIADPWFTDDFEKTKEEILLGTNGLIDYILKDKYK